jgi:predicted ester cyclase
VDGPADLEGLRKHYHPVFFELRDGVLLSDEVITAGPMAAQRYHSMLYLDGKFDGVEARGKPVHLRGQTFFQFNPDDEVLKRWSNHNHAFRMQQLLGTKGAIAGAEIALKLNGPGISENAVIQKLSEMADAYNLVQSPKQRLAQFLSFFRHDVKVHGIAQTVADLGLLSDYLERTWLAFPDLTRTDEARLSAWSYGAVRWRALGSHRGTFNDKAATLRPVLLKGEWIMKFNSDGKITEIWTNDAPIAYQ